MSTNRNKFLVELEKSLTFMEPEDREAAIAYFHELIDEAGGENEQSILDELGSPTRVAVMLGREYTPEKPAPTGSELAIPGAEEPETDGKTNTPWKGQLWRTGELPPWGFGPGTVDLGGSAAATATATETQDKPDEKNSEYSQSYRRATSETSSTSWHSPRNDSEPLKWDAEKWEATKAELRRERDREQRKNGTHRQAKREEQAANTKTAEPPVRKRKKKPLWMVLLLAFVTLPISIPVFAVGLALSLAAVAVVLALAFSGIAVCVAGVATFFSGLGALGFLPDALMMFGVGAIIFAAGLVWTWFTVWLAALIFRKLLGTPKRRRDRRRGEPV